jgi:hypothetical protein
MGIYMPGLVQFLELGHGGQAKMDVPRRPVKSRFQLRPEREWWQE